MQSSEEYKPSLEFGLLLKGKPKVGKTTLAMQFPNPWVAICDENFAGPVRYLRENFPKKKFWFDHINTISTTQPNGQIWRTPVPPEKRWDRLVELTNAAVLSPDIQTIVWDNLLSISTYLVDKILDEKPKGKEKDRMTIADWIPFRNNLTKAITLYRSVGKFFIVTCHELANKNELTGEITWQPHMPSNLSENFGGFFSDEWLATCEFAGVDENGNAKTNRIIKTVGEATRSMGTSLKLPPVFEFSWEGFEKRLKEFDEIFEKKP